jgi:CheY-like chemotaxis protein
VHLVISDIFMPEMTGAELVSMLRSWYPTMRMLFMSGYSPEHIESIAGGADVAGIHLMAKPFGLDDLLRRVRQILDEPWPERES